MKPLCTKDGNILEISAADPLDVGYSRIICGTDKNLIIQNKVFQGAPPGYGLCFLSGPTYGYAYVGHNNLLTLTDNFTIEFWFYYTGTPPAAQYPAILSKGSGTTNNYCVGLWQNTAEVYLTFYNSGWRDLRSGLYLQANAWNYVCIVVNNGTILFYVNGVISTKSFSSILLGNSHNLYIGWSNNQSGQIPNGTIDELRIYRRALSVYEIENNYNNGSGRYFPYDTTQLIGWWHFDEGTGTTAEDNSGNNLTAILHVLSDYPRWVEGKTLAGSETYKNVLSADFSSTPHVKIGDAGVDVFLDASDRNYFFSEFSSVNSSAAFTFKSLANAPIIADVRNSGGTIFQIKPEEIFCNAQLFLSAGERYDLQTYVISSGTYNFNLNEKKVLFLYITNYASTTCFLPRLDSVPVGTLVRVVQFSTYSDTTISVAQDTSDLLFPQRTWTSIRNMLCTFISTSVGLWLPVAQQYV